MMLASDPDILAALQAAFADGSWAAYQSGHVELLERQLAETFQVPFAMTCASGTLAVEVALRALKFQPGDEVICSAYDYEANFLSIHAVGAFPVLIDVASTNWNLDPEWIPGAISPRTRAILVSHLHGGLVPMSRVMEIARQYELNVIEDAAQAPGATIEGKPAGSWGDFGILSFGGSKLLTAGRGGAILIQSESHLQRAKLVLTRGLQQIAPLSELQAIVLKPQLEKLTQRTEFRYRQVMELTEAIRDLKGLQLFQNPIPNSLPAFYKVGFQFDETQFGSSRDDFVNSMRAEGVAFDEGFRALHLGRGKSRFRLGSALGEAERAHAGVVKLHHPVLLGNNSEIQQVANAIRKAYRKSI